MSKILGLIILVLDILAIIKIVQSGASTAGGTGGELQFAPDFRKRAERTGGKHGIEKKLAERARRHGAGQNLLGAEPQDRDDAGKDQENGKGGEPGAGLGGGSCCLEGKLDGDPIGMAAGS